MMKIRVVVGVLGILLLAGGWIQGQAEKPRAKGQLPPNWSKLGLSDEQRQKVYSIQSEYRSKVDALEAQIKALRKQELSEVSKVLTSGQKTRLREILASKSLLDVPDKNEKKP
jgi:hypothetical protein